MLQYVEIAKRQGFFDTSAMGIHGLTKVIADHAPKAIKESSIQSFFGRKIAIDASMSIYQFLIAVRSDNGVLTNETGETTSHLVGIFYRTIRMLENGIKPIYVFDGKPPSFKANELDKRLERRKDAEASLAEATEVGTADTVEKFNRRLVKVTKQHNDECKQLLSLMGVPYIQAPGEAEAQCSALVKAGLAFAVGSEDMDTLTFGSPLLLRHMTASEAKKLPISEISLSETLSGLNMTMNQFIDLCILLGCDYCESIKGVGPQKAVKMIQEFETLESVIANLDGKKYVIPENWPIQEVRKLFTDPDVLPDSEAAPLIKWTPPKEDELIQYLVKEKGFNEDRIRNGIKKLIKMATTATQGRLDTFFKRKEVESPTNENADGKVNHAKKLKATSVKGAKKK